MRSGDLQPWFGAGACPDSHPEDFPSVPVSLDSKVMPVSLAELCVTDVLPCYLLCRGILHLLMEHHSPAHIHQHQMVIRRARGLKITILLSFPGPYQPQEGED